ncbi:hypothetical protein [Lentilactobacillus kisonensis]|uniref:hypothetical protein n=1 Tax=Lentilactobacillus kisonensis TaxID=481722 RepID=UPI0006D1E15E|nr:hypothetical protein [Lentilactobacillus kisonensis]
MKWNRIIPLVLTASLCFAITNYLNVQASSDYQIVKTKYYTSSTPFHAKYPKQNTYLWNAKHTKRLHNLKNYPNSFWTRAKTVILRKNNKPAVYYYVAGMTPHGTPNLYGYIWRGYLKPGYNPNYKAWNGLDINYFLSDKDYQRYINQSPSQNLSREVLHLFPNARLSLNLSKLTAYGSTLTDFQKQFSDVLIVKNANNAFYNPRGKVTSANQKLTAIKAAFDAHGYNQQKRSALNGYQIGIYYESNRQKGGFFSYDDGYYAGVTVAKSLN